MWGINRDISPFPPPYGPYPNPNQRRDYYVESKAMVSALLPALLLVPTLAGAQDPLDFSSQFFGTGLLYRYIVLYSLHAMLGISRLLQFPSFSFSVAECFRQGDGAMVIGGDEISITRSVRNPSACQVLCTREPNCAYFNFFSTGGFCILFDAYALTSPPEDPMPGVTFGPRVCGE